MEKAEPAPIAYRALEIDDPWEHVMTAAQRGVPAVGDLPAADHVAAPEGAILREEDRRDGHGNDVRSNDATEVKVRLDEVEADHRGS